MVCINQALEETQSLLLEMRAKIQVLEKRNALLEAQKGKGKGRKAKVSVAAAAANAGWSR